VNRLQEFEDCARVGAWHWWGILGGMIWRTGAVLKIAASHDHIIIGPAISHAIGQGATMVSAVWGVFIWKELASAPPASRKLIPTMFIFFLLRLGSIAITPMVK
jgi:glucose uptake protein